MSRFIIEQQENLGVNIFRPEKDSSTSGTTAEFSLKNVKKGTNKISVYADVKSIKKLQKIT